MDDSLTSNSPILEPNNENILPDGTALGNLILDNKMIGDRLDCETVVDKGFDSSSSGSGEVSEGDFDEEHENYQLVDKNKGKTDVDEKTNKICNFDDDEETDDRSQTPLQDEPDNTSNLIEFENQIASNDSINKMKSNDENEFDQTKEGVSNDDHGELDYEEDDDDAIEKSKLEGEECDSPNIKKPKEDEIKVLDMQSKDEESHSSDGELADDDDCEEGEIKEPGVKKPFTRPLCRFFTRGSCTWGLNCRFLHPGVNDKGNYTMLEQHQYMQPTPPPGMMPMLRGPPPTPWIHERLGKRMPPPPRMSEVNTSELDPVTTASEGPSAGESAWERGLRHAKEIRNKRKDTDGDDKKDNSTSPSSITSLASKLIPPITSHLAPPPPRDPYYEDLHQPLLPPMPGMPPMALPMPPMMHHPGDLWAYRHPFEYDMRWPRPPPPMDFMHPGFHPVHDFRLMDQGRGRRFSPPLRIEAGGRGGVDRMSRYDRYRTTEGQVGAGEGRGKCEEWKDPWSRTKSPKHKRSSSSRSGSRKKSRSKGSYSSFSSSSYSSKSRSGSRSSSFSSYSSSRSSFSSRSRSSSKSKKSIPKKVVPVGSLDKSNKISEAPKSVVSKVVPPCVAELNDIYTTTASKPVVINNKTANSQTITKGPYMEPSKPPLVSLSITLGNKPSLSNSKTNQLQPVNKAVADAFKDADEDNTDNQMKVKSKMSKLPPASDSNNLMDELNKTDGQVTTAGGITYKSGIVQGNVGYPIPIKSSVLPSTQDKQPKLHSSISKSSRKKKNSKSQGSSASSNGYSSSSSSSSHSSHSSSSSNSNNVYSDMASPISSDSSPNNHKRSQVTKMSSVRGHMLPTRVSNYPPPKPSQPYMVDRSGRGFREGRGGAFRGERRDYRMEGRGVMPGGNSEMIRGTYRRDYRIDERGMPHQDYPVRGIDHSRIDPKMINRPGGRSGGDTLDARMDMRDDRINDRMVLRNEGRRDDYRMQDRRIIDQRMDNRIPRERDNRSHSNNKDRNINTRHQRREGEVEVDGENWGRQPRESPGECRRVVNKSMMDAKYQGANTLNRPFQRQPELPLPTSRKRPSSPHHRSPHEKHMRLTMEHKDPPPRSDKGPLPLPRSTTTGSRQQRSNITDDSNRRSSPSSKHGKPQTSSGGKKLKIIASPTSSRREELLMQLKAVEDAIAKKRSKNQ